MGLGGAPGGTSCRIATSVQLVQTRLKCGGTARDGINCNGGGNPAHCPPGIRQAAVKPVGGQQGWADGD